MGTVALRIDNTPVTVDAGSTLLQAALAAGIYIPHLCRHPDLPGFESAKPSDVVFRGAEKIEKQADGAYEGCGLCAVQVEGEKEFMLACNSPVRQGMVVTSQSPELATWRQHKLAAILNNHPHACLTCAQQEGCSLTQCSSNVPEDLRCCPQFNHCELRKVADFIGIPADVTRYTFKNLPKIEDEPLFVRDYNLCIGCTRCIRACADEHGEAAIGYVRSGEGIIVGAVGASPSESGCRFCGACVEVCPTGALADKDIRWASREEELLPCKSTCPINLDIPEYTRCIAQGDFTGAAKIIRAKTPLGAVLGMVCFHPCEDTCRRGLVSDPVAICALKRFAMEAGTNSEFEKKPAVDPSGKRVAIIGAGPAGLTAVHYLVGKGHGVTLFEARAKAGGMLRYGIPKYRLPEEVLDKDVNAILTNDLVEMRFGAAVGDSFGYQSILDEGFDAVLIAVGTQKGKALPVNIGNVEHFRQGIDFLQSVADGQITGIPFSGRRIVVIGGGNVAIDAARTSLRLGAAQVDLVCLESCNEMPAHDLEVKRAEEEGVRFHHSWGVSNIVSREGPPMKVELMECCSVFDDEGKFDPSFNKDIADVLEADEIIAAIGQEADLAFLGGGNLALNANNVIEVKRRTMETSVKGVFAAGDVAGGPASVVEAIASGIKTARAIEKFLGVDESITGEDYSLAHGKRLGRIEGFADLQRISMPYIDPESRRGGFQVVETGYDADSAMAEAHRCLGCDFRLRLAPFVPPPEKWMEFNTSNVNSVPEVEGVFQLLDESKETLSITGTINLKRELSEKLEGESAAAFFLYEIDPMYTKRESELIQQYMQEHGEMPSGGDDDLDDLF